LFLLLLLLLLLFLLLWLHDFDMCYSRGRSLINQVFQAVKSAAGGRTGNNFDMETVGEASPGTIVEDFFVLL
jgi:hypothetical protein